MANIKTKDLKAILAEVESELGGLLKTESEKLAKNRDEDEGGSPGEAEGSADASPAPTASPTPSPEGGEGGAAPEGASPSAPADPSAPPADGASPDAAPADGMDPAAGEGEITDPAQLEPEYDKLSVESLKAHYLAAKAALYRKMETAGGAPAPSASPSAAPPAAPAPAAGASGPSAPPSPSPELGKKEVAGTTVPNQPIGDTSPRVAKSEDEGKVAELEAQVALLNKAVEILTQPIRKAVTEVPYVGKPGTSTAAGEKPIPTGTALTKKLTEVTADPKLSKSDRQKVNDYFDRKVGVEAIAHLLK